MVSQVMRKTSFSVFLSFAKVLASGKACARGMLSDSCFQQWVCTRKASIKHPKDSFRRTLLAHLRCCDGRQPFPEEVESSLLSILRHEENPWDFLYGSGKKKRVRRSVQLNSAYGYHERKAKLQKIKVKSEQLDLDQPVCLPELKLDPQENLLTLVNLAITSQYNSIMAELDLAT